jgi:hypothetical protein
MVIPAGLPDAQQLVLVDKEGNGRVTMREILPVLFSQLRGNRRRDDAPLGRTGDGFDHRPGDVTRSLAPSAEIG